MTTLQLACLELWVSALRNKNFKQGRGLLRSWITDPVTYKTQVWTALGLAVQIFYTGPDLDQVIENQSDLSGLGVEELIGLDSVGSLPNSILVQIPMGDNTQSGKCTSIQCLNDRARYTFSQIADQIERQIIKPQKAILGV